MSVLRIVLQVILAISSFLLTLLILLHKGKGGGLSDMFGGGVTTSLSGSEHGRAEPQPLHRRSRPGLVRHDRRPRPGRAVHQRVLTSPQHASTETEAGRGPTWQVATPSGAAGSAPAPWARRNAGTPRPASDLLLVRQRARDEAQLRRGVRRRTARDLGLPAVRVPRRHGPGQPARPAEERAVQDAPGLREGAPLRRRRRGHPQRGARRPAGPRSHPLSRGRRHARRPPADPAGGLRCVAGWTPSEVGGRRARRRATACARSRRRRPRGSRSVAGGDPAGRRRRAFSAPAATSHTWRARAIAPKVKDTRSGGGFGRSPGPRRRWSRRGPGPGGRGNSDAT